MVACMSRQHNAGSTLWMMTVASGGLQSIVSAELDLILVFAAPQGPRMTRLVERLIGRLSQ